MIQAFLFDLDGTLVDTHKANYEAYKAALSEQDVDISWDQYRPTIGMQSSHFLPILAPNLSSNQIAAVRQAKAVHYEDLVHLTEQNDALVNFMKSLSQHYKIGLVTTAQKQSAEMVLKEHDLYKHFDVIVTAADVANHKPNPEGYKLALSKLNVAAQDALAFEDSDTGIAAARAAGIKVVKIQEFMV